MEVFFYCSYEHSQTGYFMTRLEDLQLVPAKQTPKMVEEFFSYDRFQILWRDMSPEYEKKFWKPQTEGMFLGLRNLRGEMAGGRKAIANIVFLGNGEDEQQIRRIALSILGDYPQFQSMFTQWLSVSSENSYRLDTEAFCRWMDSCRNAKRLTMRTSRDAKAADLLARMRRTQEPRTEADLLRLAVYTTDWKDIAQVMGPGVIWKLKHPCAMTQEEFEQIFERRAPLWELVAED